MDDQDDQTPHLRLVPHPSTRRKKRGAMTFMDLWFLLQVAGPNQSSQHEVHPEFGEAAAAQRLRRAGLLYENFPGAGYGITEAGCAMVDLFIATLNHELVTRRRRS